MGVTGKFSGKKLEVLPSVLTTWKKWREDHPETLVLSRRTSYRRDYGRNPYAAYHKTPRTMFPMKGIDKRLPAKSLVIGIKTGWASKAYPIKLVQRSKTPIKDKVGGEEILVYKGPENTAYIKNKKGELLPGIIAYWFAWSAFDRGTLVYGKKR
jgi:hypothetical protein